MKKTINTMICAILTMTMAAASGFAAGNDAYAFSGSNPFGSSGYSSYAHNDRFSDSLIANGVDVSEYQGSKSDWAKAKESGVDFAILRASWTGYGSAGTRHTDENFATNFKRAKAAGIMTGVYVFSQAKTVDEAVAEAELGIKTLNATLKSMGLSPDEYAATLELPIYMDYEYAGPKSGNDKGRLHGISRKQAIKCANAFCRTVRKAGYTAGIYANTSFFNNILTDNDSNAATRLELDEGIELWCAQYYSMNQSGKDYNIWQFSSSAKIRDIYNYRNNALSSTDVNFWYIDRASELEGPGSEPVVCYGQNTYNYTGKPVTTDFELRQGDRVLEQGRDYLVGYVNNVHRGNLQAYAYIRGLGEYSGYMTVPFTIGMGYIKNKGLADCKYESVSGYAFGNKTEEAFEQAELTENAETEGEQSELTEAADEQNEEDQIELPADAAYVLSTSGERFGDAENMAVPEESADGTTELSSEEAAEDAETEQSESADAALAGDEAQYVFGIGEKHITGVPAGLTAEEFLCSFASAEGYGLKLLDNRGNEVAGDAAVETGMLIGVYDSEGILIGTAVVAVDGSLISGIKGSKPTNAKIEVSFDSNKFYCTGKVQKPAVTVTWNGISVANKIKSSSSYVKLSYSSGCKKPGTYKVSATGIAYPGSASASFTIVVKPTRIESLTAGSKCFTVRAEKLTSAYASGYQLRYSKNADFNGAKTVTIGTRYSKNSRKVRKLTSGATYNVQVRTYRKVGTKKYYSSWSEPATVTIP